MSLTLDPKMFNELMLASNEAQGHEATDNQCKAGNYRKGKCRISGMDIMIEQPRYSYRTGTDKETGKKWASLMSCDYGYIAGTKGADGDAIDCFIGALPESNVIYVINQIKDNGQFDEHKAMIGFTTYEEAKTAYQNSYTIGWGGFADMIACTLGQFKWWLKFGNHSQPITRDSLPFDSESEYTMDDLHFNWAEGDKPTAARAMYEMGRTDINEELLESVDMPSIMDDIFEEGGEIDEESVMDALVIKNSQLERRANIIGKQLNRAGGKIQVAENGVQVSKPYKMQGTTQRVIIYEMTDGQTVSVFLHNPDIKPNQISAEDNLIAWRWLLNRKDITIVVAKEKGKDISIQQLANRVMALINKNSDRFQKANSKKTERIANIASLEQTFNAKREKLENLVNKINELKNPKAESPKVEPPIDNPPVENQEADTLPTEKENNSEGNSVVDPEGEDTHSTPNPEGKTPDLEVDLEAKNTDSQPDSEGGAESNQNTANFLQAVIDNGDITSFGFDVSGLDDEKLLDVLGDLDSQIPIADSEERDLLENASQVLIDRTFNAAKVVI